MPRGASKGKARRRSPTPSSSSVDGSDHAPDSDRPPKRLRLTSPERVQATTLARVATRSSTSSAKGLAGLAALVNDSKLAAAYTETKRGLRSGKGGPSRGPSSRVTSRSKGDKIMDDKIFVGRIIFLVVGIVPNTRLISSDSSTIPPVYCLRSPVDISVNGLPGLMQTGLCAMQSNGFEFSFHDTYTTITDKLAAIFPRVFAWMRENEPADGLETTWLLCMKPPRKSLIVYSDGHTLPTGSDIMNVSQLPNSKAGLQDRTLYIVTRDRIPPSVVATWRPKPPKSRAFSSLFDDNLDTDDSDHSDEGFEAASTLPAAVTQTGASSNVTLGSPSRSQPALQDHSVSEVEVERDVITISDSDEADPAASAPTPPHVSSLQTTTGSSSFICFGNEENPWL